MRELVAELKDLKDVRTRTAQRSRAPLLERRVITAVTIEVARAPDAVVQLNPERLKHVVDRAIRELAALITGEGGFVERAGGDAILARFGAPVAHADDPLRALRAAQACVQWAEPSRHRPV